MVGLTGKILMVDDEEDLLKTASQNLARAGHMVKTAASAEDANRLLEQESFDVVLLDLRLPGMGGLQLLQWMRSRSRREQVVILTAYAEVESAVQAMKDGAFGYIAKPFIASQVLAEIDRILQAQALGTGNKTLLAQQHRGLDSLVGEHPKMQQVRELVAEAAATPLPVLIRGETGTGKELVAEAIHVGSQRADKPLVRCNCAAFPQGTLESELFGHVRGAYTGAVGDRKGRFEEANGGSLFLDEIGDLTPEAQIRLLRVLQEHQFEPVGSTEGRHVDVRIITATHQDMEAARASGRFREDLFHRINGMVIQLPPLREHLSDLPLLCDFIIRRDRSMVGKQVEAIEAGAVDVLRRYAWPGNVRELENVLRGAMVRAQGKTVQVRDLEARVSATPTPVADEEGLWRCEFASLLFHDARKQMEVALIRQVLKETGGNISRAALRMKLGRRNLQKKIQEYGIDVAEYTVKRGRG